MLIHIKNEGIGPLEFASSIGFSEGVNLLQDVLDKNTNYHGEKNGNIECHKNPPELRIQDSGQSEYWEGSQERLKRLPADAPELRIEDIRPSEHWEGRHERLKRLLDDKKIENLDEGPKIGSDPHSMSLALYIAAKKGDVDGFIDALYAPVSLICNQMTPLKNTVLHVAAIFGNEDLAGFLAHHFRSLLSKRNHRGSCEF